MRVPAFFFCAPLCAPHSPAKPRTKNGHRASLNICAITFRYISLWETSVTQDARKDWRNLCREAVSERDPYKLIAIVDELNRELDEEQKKKAAVFLQKIDKKTA